MSERSDYITLRDAALCEVYELRQRVDRLKAEREQLREAVAKGTSNTLEDISFREAVRSEILSQALKENDQLRGRVAELENKPARVVELQPVVRCTSCGGTQMYKQVDGEIHVLHDCTAAHGTFKGGRRQAVERCLEIASRYDAPQISIESEVAQDIVNAIRAEFADVLEGK
jgi:hypothetical protein